MKPEKMIERLTLMERHLLKQRKTDVTTKYQTLAMFKELKKFCQYQVPMPPIEVSEDKQYFVCPRCGWGWDTYETGNTIDDFMGCPHCLQRWNKEQEKTND